MAMTVTAQAMWAAVPQVVLDVSSSPAMQDALQVWRVHEDGSRHRVITSQYAVLNGTWTGVDYHCPFNQPVQYVAAKTGEESAPSAPAYLPSERAWLIHASNPELSLAADMLVGPVPATSRKSRSQVIDLPGRADPVVIASGRRSSPSGQLLVWCDTVDAMRRVEALLDDDGPILVLNPDDDHSWRWIQPGDDTYEVPAGRSKDARRQVGFSWRQCAQPDVDLLPPWSVADVTALGLTVSQLAATYSTVRGLALNVPG